MVLQKMDQSLGSGIAVEFFHGDYSRGVGPGRTGPPFGIIPTRLESLASLMDFGGARQRGPISLPAKLD